MRKALAFLFALLALPLAAQESRAQEDGLLQVGDEVHRFLLRQQAAGRLPHAHLVHQPLSAYEARRYLDRLALRAERLTPTDRALLARYRGAAAGPFAEKLHRRLPPLYGNGRDLFSVRGDGYALQVNPLLYLSYGRARQSGTPLTPVWQNTRGVRASGHVGEHFFFEARVEETQRRVTWPAYARFTAPRLGLTRIRPDSLVYDYQVATGIVGLRSRFFEVRFGRDRNRWGFGQGSLVLSNYAPAYDQLQIRTTFWRLQYVNLFAAITDVASVPALPNQLLPRRYGAFHHLSLALPARLQLELFESVIFASQASEGRRRAGFDLTYLNPVLFYRVAEADRGSPDNVLLGGGLSWVAVPGLQLYGQLLLDELRIGEIGEAWAHNKWGWVGGLHAADVLSGLSARLEYARLRPYLYSHHNPLNAFVHFDDLIGHPAGPNAEDLALLLDYRPAARLHAALNFAYTRRGRDTPEQNWGADPLRPYHTAVRERGVYLLQGVRQETLLLEVLAGYEVLPDLYVEAAFLAESVRDAEHGLDRYAAPFLMLRWGLPFQSVRY